MKRDKGVAQQLVADTLARMGGEQTSGAIATEAKLSLGYTSLLLRDLVHEGKAEKVCHGVYRSVVSAGKNGNAAPAGDPEVHRLAGLRRGAKGDDTETTALANVSRIVTAMSNMYSRKAVEYGPLSPARAKAERVAVSLKLAEQHVQRAVATIRGEES